MSWSFQKIMKRKQAHHPTWAWINKPLAGGLIFSTGPADSIPISVGGDVVLYFGEPVTEDGEEVTV